MSQMKAGAILSYITIMINIAVALIYTPIVISNLTQSEYGLFALIGSIIAYFSVMDLGLGNTIIRYISRNRVKGDKISESNLNGLFLKLYSLISLLAIIIGLIVYNNFELIFNTNFTEKELQQGKVMILIVIINFAFSFPLSIFGSFVQAYERFIFFRISGIARILLIPFITVPFLLLGYGPITMIAIITFVNLLYLLVNVYYSYKYLNIKFQFKGTDRDFLKEILGYSFFVFLGVIVDQLNWNTNQFILGIFTGTASVAIFAIAMQFITMYRQLSASLSSMLLPRISNLVANNATTQELTLLMIKVGRIQFFILCLILSGFILFGEYFILNWASEEYSSAYYIVLIIIIPLTIPLIQNVGVSILYAKNIQGFRSVVLIIIALLNLALAIPLTIKFDAIGAAWATAISLSIGNIAIMNIYYHKKLKIDMILFWKNIIRLMPPILIIYSSGMLLNSVIANSTIIIYGIKVTIFVMIYFFVIWSVALNDYEKNIFISIFSTFKKIFKNNKLT